MVDFTVDLWGPVAIGAAWRSRRYRGPSSRLSVRRGIIAWNRWQKSP